RLAQLPPRRARGRAPARRRLRHDQRLAAAVPPRRLRRAPAGHARGDRGRPATAAHRAGRKRAARGSGRCCRDAAAPARRRRGSGAGRLRHRFLVAGLRAPLPATHGQDRPQLRGPPRRRAGRAQPRGAGGHGRAGARARARGAGGRRRDRGATRRPARDGLPPGPGRPVPIRVGIGGWTYAPWRDNFYPKGLVQRRELEYASRHVTAIEVNGTYYGTQKPATYARWRDEAPDGFVFAAKAPKRIMQARVLARTGLQVEDFVGGIATLGAKLGPLLWQFDRGVRIDRDDFTAFLALLPKQADGVALRHVLDVRDPAFVDGDFLALARSHGCATVFTDSGEHPSFADLTADFVYARLM